MMQHQYPIGEQGTPWGEEEIAAWFKQNSIHRSYHQHVVSEIEALAQQFDVQQYGALSYHESRYPLFAIRNKQWNKDKPVVLITGGVHGYETSGVHGALLFLQSVANQYTEVFNFLVVPCVSPWGYETINRWNPNAVDPNRSFYSNSPAEESANLMNLVGGIDEEILIHIDLHETTDTDESEFRPALAARDGVDYVAGEIPDGFYTVGDSLKPQADFQKAVIESVSKVTHIAEADAQGELIGSPIAQFGVIYYPMESLGLCGGMTDAKYHTTTEVYPDSAQVTDDECNQAQVAAITGALDYVLAQ
ncbi:M14 family metallocarboxypeptidase [Vibrio sp. 99-8-1]|uniref:M14 family metallopeptidase n=1 Tax=Vibrio sp. 99-8-1 TaxID=2607602 RepID=UPI0014937D5A|nr:M14 family metallocarboxypeptidase [Vibrio sp. 99-8-1]NOI65202.1 M14 family metallocarboxypeptidase [Vibrio sp. 99-8-1]